MNLKSAALALTLAIVTCVQARAKTILPDACGDNKVGFEIKTKKDQPQPGAPEAGKALIVFIETSTSQPFSPAYEVRFGIDGSWAGAAKGKAYFVVSVTPGEHHLCSSTQGINLKEAAALELIVEAGKTYYYEAAIGGGSPGGGAIIGGGPGAPMMVHGGGTRDRFSFLPLSDDEGKYRVKAWPLSISSAKD